MPFTSLVAQAVNEISGRWGKHETLLNKNSSSTKRNDSHLVPDREGTYQPDVIDETIASSEWTLKVNWDHLEQLQMTVKSVMSSFGLKVEVRHNRDLIAEHHALLEARLGHFLESSDIGDHSHEEDGSFRAVSLTHQLDKAFSKKKESVSVYVEGTAEKLGRAESWILAHHTDRKASPN